MEKGEAKRFFRRRLLISEPPSAVSRSPSISADGRRSNIWPIGAAITLKADTAIRHQAIPSTRSARNKSRKSNAIVLIARVLLASLLCGVANEGGDFATAVSVDLSHAANAMIITRAVKMLWPKH